MFSHLLAVNFFLLAFMRHSTKVVYLWRKQTETDDVAARSKVASEKQIPEHLISPSPTSSSAQSTSTHRLEAGTKFSFPYDVK